MVIAIHEKPIYIVSIYDAFWKVWKEIFCTTNIDRAITRGNEWLDKGIDVSVATWTTEMDFETCTLGVEENEVFVGDEDGIVTWKEKENK